MYNDTIGGAVFLVTERLDPATDHAVMIAGEYGACRARGLANKACKQGSISAYVKTLDETYLIESEQKNYEPFRPPQHTESSISRSKLAKPTNSDKRDLTLPKHLMAPNGSPADRTGFETTTNYISTALAKLVPAHIAKRAIAVDIKTDKTRYQPGEPVTITAIFNNRLPVPVDVPTQQQRKWGWTIDGIIEATVERRYLRDSTQTFSFRAGETKRIDTRWDGRIRDREAGTATLPDRGRHTIGVFLGTERRPTTTTEIQIGD